LTGNFPPLDRLVPSHIKDFEAYIPSKPDDELKKLYRCPTLFRMNNNENPLGPPLAAREVIRTFDPARAAIYPSGDAWHLRNRLAELFDMHPDSFIVGNGANEVISFVIKAFCREGDNIITADRTFAVYEWVAQFSGFEAKVIPLVDDVFDDESMLAAIDDRTKILFVCNPNNPTGTYWNEEKLRRFLDRVGGNQIVVVDQAYGEFVDNPDFPDAMKMIKEYPNLVVFRTFSKMYGLASLRIGYLAGDRAVVDVIRRTCVVYSVNALAQEAALAALEDGEAHIKATRELCRANREILKECSSRLGLESTIREGNYAIMKLPISDTLAYRLFMKKGYMIRTLTGFRIPGCIRISFHHPSVMEGFAHALEEILDISAKRGAAQCRI
jgi:histidinol-phosphate aminotransferase